jgi:hypothetical protein
MSKSKIVSFIQRDLGITNPKTNGHPNYVVLQVGNIAIKNRKTKAQKSLGLSFSDYLSNRFAMAGYLRLLVVNPSSRHPQIGGITFENSLDGFLNEFSKRYKNYIPVNVISKIVVESARQNLGANLSNIGAAFRYTMSSTKTIVDSVDAKYTGTTKTTYRSNVGTFLKFLAEKEEFFKQNPFSDFKLEKKNPAPVKKNKKNQINLFDEIDDVQLEMLLLEVVLQFKELTIDDFLSFERLPVLSNDKTGILEKLSRRTNNPFKHLSEEKIAWLKKMRVKADEITALFDEGKASAEEKKQLIKLFVR